VEALLRKAGLVDSESFRLYFQAIFEDALIGELKIPTQITATDMVEGRLKIFESETKISDALLASSAFPGIISPYINGEPYSDGGILNHFLRIYYKANVTILSVFMSVLFKNRS
jgi:NTE family protein